MKGRNSVLALLLGVAVLLWVLWTLGIPRTWTAIKQAKPGYLGVTLILFALASLVRIHKWRLMRDRMGVEIRFGELSGIYFSSRFWGLLTPMRSGEVAPALLGDGKEAMRGSVLSIILYDRVLETFQSITVFVALFFLLYGTIFDMKAGYALAGVTLVVAAFTAVIASRRAGEKVFGFADWALALFGRRSAHAIRSYLEGFKGEMEAFYSATRSYFAPGFSLYVLFLTFVCWAVDMLSWVALFRAFSIETGLIITASAVMAYSMIAALAPVPWGLGLSDLSFAMVLGRFGYTGEVGGLIIISRAMVLGFAFAGYAAFSMPAFRKKLDA